MKITNVPLTVRVNTQSENLERKLDELSDRLRVAVPGIIESFDAENQLVSVRVAIRERVSIDGEPFEHMEVPILEKVPIFMPRAGNFILTMPIAAGDECLLVFADNCYDSWWETAAVGNQLDNRRHDLSDAFAIVGIWSKPNIIRGYSEDSAVLRSLAGDSYVEVKDSIVNVVTSSQVNVQAPAVNVTAQTTTVNSTTVEVTGGTITLTGSSGVVLAGGGNSKIDDKNFLNHIHKDAEDRNTTGVQ
jgi:hypothetical protein